MNLFVNWKTTSAGLATVAGAITALIFQYKNNTWNEATTTAAITGLLTGLGLIFARDVNVTSTDLGLQTSVKKADAKTVVTDTPTN